MPFNKALIFLGGVICGVVLTLQYAKEKYRKIEEENVASVKEAFSRRKAHSVEKKAVEVVKPQNNISSAALDTPRIHVIPPDDFGEMEDYDEIELFYFEDRVIGNNFGEVIDPDIDFPGIKIEEHFGEFDGDEETVYIRNEDREIDYAIMKEYRTYADFKKYLPPNIEMMKDEEG